MATTTATMTSKVTSTASSPNVNYSAAYTATRTDETTKTVSVKLNYSAWLPSSGSKLGTGIKLTIYARINGGAWKSVVLKSTSAVWSGTAKHTASLTLSASTTSSTAKIEWYVSRTGSTYSGTAGTLASASGPKAYNISLPAYSAGGSTPVDPDPAPTSDKYVYVRVGGAWKQAVPYVRVGGLWKKVTAAYVRINGAWKSN